MRERKLGELGTPLFSCLAFENSRVQLEMILGESQTACYAWALMLNHFHMLLRTRNTPIARVVRQLLSVYAGRFNRVHRRSGHLFQNATKLQIRWDELYIDPKGQRTTSAAGLALLNKWTLIGPMPAGTAEPAATMEVRSKPT